MARSSSRLLVVLFLFFTRNEPHNRTINIVISSGRRCRLGAAVGIRGLQVLNVHTGQLGATIDLVT